MRLIFTVAIALTPLVAVIAPKGMALLFIVTAAAIVAASWCQGYRYITWRPLALMTAVITGWALLSSTWAISPGQSAATSLRLGASCAAGLWMVAVASQIPADRHRRLLTACAAVMAISLVLLAVDYLFPNSVSGLLFRLLNNGAEMALGFKSRLSRGATVLCLLLWPVAVLVARHVGRTAALGVIVPTIAVLLISDSGSSKLSMLAGAGTFAAAGLFPRIFPQVLRISILLLMLIAPIIASHLPSPQDTFANWHWLPNSSHHRMTIWAFSATTAAEKPILGWGMDASRDIPGGDEEITVRRSGPSGKVVSLVESQLPLHPHNAILQWWLELGAVGLALIGGWVWILLGGIRGLDAPPWERAACFAVFASAFTISVVSYGFWQYWWQSTMWIAAALCALVVGRSGREAASTSKKEA